MNRGRWRRLSLTTLVVVCSYPVILCADPLICRYLGPGPCGQTQGGKAPSASEDGRTRWHYFLKFFTDHPVLQSRRSYKLCIILKVVSFFLPSPIFPSFWMCIILVLSSATQHKNSLISPDIFLPRYTEILCIYHKFPPNYCSLIWNINNYTHFHK